MRQQFYSVSDQHNYISIFTIGRMKSRFEARIGGQKVFCDCSQIWCYT